MAPKKKKTNKIPPQAEQDWAQLEAALDREMQILGPSREEAGRILYQMKRWLQKWGLNRQGRGGRWQKVCDRHEIDRKTAENWIRLYQRKAGIPAGQYVVAPGPAPRKSQQNGGKNPVNATGMDEAEIEVADNKNADSSHEGRIAVECVFVLTMAEKIKFMEAVDALGSTRATQLMYLAVVNG
jgi:transposase-like protein